MNGIQYRRLHKLADFLEGLKPSRLVMEVFGEDKRTGETAEPNVIDCKTAGCALGWATQIFKRSGFKWDGYPVYQGYEGLAAGSVFFGVSHDDAHTLFMPGPKNHTPKQVANNLRYYADVEQLPESIRPVE